MSSYRSAYENYYKNINNASKGKKDKNKFQVLSRKTDNSNRSIYGVNVENNTMTNAIVKRIIRELTGATILLLFFVALKYIPSAEIQKMHVECKNTLSYNFDYDQCIDAFNTTQIGDVEGKDLKIGNFTTEDLRIKNLKEKASNFIEYLKNNTNMQN